MLHRLDTMEAKLEARIDELRREMKEKNDAEGMRCATLAIASSRAGVTRAGTPFAI